MMFSVGASHKARTSSLLVMPQEAMPGIADALQAERRLSGKLLGSLEPLLDELATVEHSNIQRVYSSLENGSENHLRAYVSTLARQTGETYEPQILDQTTFSQIVSSTTGRGRRSGRSF